jgi:hypothetical protein
MKKIILLIAGAIGVLLGGLWFLQGTGAVTIAPILCVADCAPLEGPSPIWAVIGFVVFVAGALGIYYGVRRVPQTGGRP